MDKFWSTCDYLLDFNKVRSFQELCGLRADESANDDKKHQPSEIKQYDELLTKRKTGCQSDEIQFEDKKNYCKNYVPNGTGNISYTVHNWLLYYLFRFGSILGQEIFYITFIPFVFWNIDPYIGRKMLVVWVVTMYIGQALKDLIKWPRPTSPAFKLETRVQAEYGLPSTHAIAGTVLPFSMVLASYGRYDIPLALGVFVAVLWCLLVSLSRIYVGMHSFLDIVCGVTIGAVYLAGGWPFMGMVEDYTLSSKYSPWLIMMSHFLLGYFYPAPDHYSTTRGDTVMILASGAGVQCGSWIIHQYQIDLSPHNQLTSEILFSSTFWMMACVRFVIGGFILAIARTAFKEVALNIVCHAIGVSKHKQESRRRRDVEVVYKFITYAAVGLAIIMAPFVMTFMGAEF